MLLLAFLCVGVTVGYVTLASLAENRERSAGDDLISYAALLSGQITSEQYAAATDPSPEGARSLAYLRSNIQNFAKRLSGVRSIYTVRPKGVGALTARFHRVLQFYGPAGSVPTVPSNPTLRLAFATANPAMKVVDAASAGGTPTAYIPLVAGDGHTSAVLVVEGTPGRSSILPPDWLKWSWVIAGALLLASLLCTSIIARQIFANSGTSGWTRSLRAITRAIRNPILEFLLVVTTITSVASGYHSASQWQANGLELQGIQSKIDRLEDLARNLARDYSDQPVSRQALVQEAGELGLADVAANLTHRGRNASDSRAFIRQVESRVAELRFSRDTLQEQQAKNEFAALITLWIAGFMVLASIVLIRVAAGQQTDLESAELDSARLQGAYSQVAENLPIGLFSYQGNVLKFTNKVWDQLTNRFPFENRMDALMRTIHREDAPRLQMALEEGERTRKPFDIQYRLLNLEGQERIIESRAVPILDPDGQLEYLLGFGLDVTDMLDAQKQLQQRNKDVSAKNSQLHKALTDIEDNFEAMVHSLVKAVEAKDPYTAGHSERVMGYSVRIGEFLNLPAKELRVLERGALVHDIGKIGVPDALLTKPSALTEEEFAIVKQHPMIGFRMIQGIPIFHECVPIVLWHHERLDGKGYPDRLSGDQIPLLVRITAVADCFDAMTSNRAYRKGMDVERALNLLRADATNGALDPEIVEVLVKVVNRDGLLWQATEITAA